MADSVNDTLSVLAIDDAVLRASITAGYGITDTGFVPKPFARLLAEKLATARGLFGADIDIGSGSVLRKLLEISALEDARTWAALASVYDNQFVSTAKGEALSRLGEELGLERPFLEATGHVKLTASLPANVSGIAMPRGARMLTPGRHHVALADDVALSRESPSREVGVVAFYPGPEHNLDPSKPSQKITWWNQDDPKLAWSDDSLLSLAHSVEPNVAPEELVRIEHTQPMTGGELRWPDLRFRQLLLQAPRSIWTLESIRTALSLLPGVRQVQVRDRVGGLDVNQPIFGTFNFVERLFGAERDLASPYFLDVIVAATEAAIWDGPDGLAAAIDAAVEDLRPIGIRPSIQPVDSVYVGVAAKLLVTGLPLPRGSSGKSVNDSQTAMALKQRLLARVGRYVNGLGLGEPVRAAEVMWALMSEPGIADVQGLRLERYPPAGDGSEIEAGDNVPIRPTQIATFVDSADKLRII